MSTKKVDEKHLWLMFFLIKQIRYSRNSWKSVQDYLAVINQSL